MRKLVGILNDRKIYDTDPKLAKWQCDAAYVAVWGISDSFSGKTHCDYCGRKVDGDECISCGAPKKAE